MDDISPAWRGFWCATIALVSVLVGGLFFLWGIFYDYEWNFFAAGESETSTTGTGLAFTGLGLLLLSGMLPAWFMRAPWWSGLLCVPLAGVATGIFSWPFIMSADQRGWYGEGGYLLSIAACVMFWFLLGTMLWAKRYVSLQFWALVATTAVCCVLTMRVDSGVWLLLLWFLIWVAQAVIPQLFANDASEPQHWNEQTGPTDMCAAPSDVAVCVAAVDAEPHA